MEGKSTNSNRIHKIPESQEKIMLTVNDQKIQNIAQKLKENTTLFFKQIKLGCFREFCYNPYCAKSGCKNFI
jgi:hypothetical protein